MNLTLTKSNKRHLNLRWEPFATSTPLKVVPNKVSTENESPKELPIHINSLDVIRKNYKTCSSANIIGEKPAELKHLVVKRPRKNKSCANFDFSSSDEDSSNENKKRPIIKLSSKKPTKLLLNNEKVEVGRIKIIEKISATKKNHILSCTETNESGKSIIPNVKVSEQNYNHVPKNKKKKQNRTVNSALENLNLDEEKQISNKARVSSHVKTDSKLYSENKKNTKKYLKSYENLKCVSDCDKFKTKKSKKLQKNMQRADTYIKNDTEILKSLQKTNLENKELCEGNKKHNNSILNSGNYIKVTRSRKYCNKLSTPVLNGHADNATTPVCLFENKINLSHQLFSDSREQELINILDLTSEEVIEAKESKTQFLWQKQKKFLCSSLTSPHPSNQKNCFEKREVNKHRKRLNLKKIQMPENLSKEQLCIADEKQQPESNLKVSKRSDEQELQLLNKAGEVEMFLKEITENNSENNGVRFKEVERKAKKKVSKIGKKKETLNSVKTNMNNTELKNTDANGIKNNLDSVVGISKNCESNEPFQPENVQKTKAENTVFKLINELIYEEDKTGCSAVECWNINTFKCGVFKLKVKSKMTCKTLHVNSYLGGVLIKGNLKMKIDNNELDLNEGDMAFVPPLTDWQATNIGECESLFYYWCGRFKI